MKFISVSLTIFLVACAGAKRTQYQEYKKKTGGGYTEQSFEEDLRMVSFRANTRTKQTYADAFARFRAVEICSQEKKKYAHIVGVIDRSESRTVTRSSGNVYGFPSYYYGYSPFHGRYSGIGFGASFNSMDASSWEETYVSPHVDVLFRCEEDVFEPEVIVREVPSSEMKHLVKDLKGALQVEKVLPESPNKDLRKGDIILKAGGERLDKSWELIKHFRKSDSIVPVELLRDGEKTRLSLKGRSVSKELEVAQKQTIDTGCTFEEIKKRTLCL